MRVGRNPFKGHGAPRKCRPLTLVTVTHVPELAGYWEHSLDVLVHCLDSAAQHTSAPHDLIVIDNGSCEAARKLLSARHREGMIDFLVLAPGNLGKVGAWNVALSAAQGEYVAYFDSDVEFRAGWLEESMRVLKAIDVAGSVTALPVKTAIPPKSDRDSTGRDYLRREDHGLRVEWGSDLIPQEYIDEHLSGLGVSDGRRGFPALEARIEKDGTIAYLGGSHFQFLTKKSIVEQILPIPVTEHPLGDDYVWDERLNELGYLRLGTSKPLVKHLGNTLEGAIQSTDGTSPPRPLGGQRASRSLRLQIMRSLHHRLARAIEHDVRER